MTCPLCRQFREKHPLIHGKHVLITCTMGPIVCAFENSEVFSTENWNCQTMTAFRDLFNEYTMNLIRRNDTSTAMIAIPDHPNGQVGVLVLAWYKNRGQTGRAMIFNADEEVELLNLKTALVILESKG